MVNNSSFHDLAGQSVFIAGGGSGIGATLTDELLPQGTSAGFIDRPDANDFLTDMKARRGPPPLFVQVDIANTDQLQDAMRSIGQAHGSIDFVANNAAIEDWHTLDDVTEDHWHQKQLDPWATPEKITGHLDRQCLKDRLVPADIVDPVLFPASKASRMMTGQCMAVNGSVVVSG